MAMTSELESEMCLLSLELGGQLYKNTNVQAQPRSPHLEPLGIQPRYITYEGCLEGFQPCGMKSRGTDGWISSRRPSFVLIKPLI